MTFDAAYEALVALEGIDVARDVCLADRTTYRIGGPVRLLACAGTREGLVAALSVLRREGVPTLILGGGSNLLVADAGFEGCAVTLGAGLDGLEVDGERIVAGGGARLSSVVAAARREGLAGLEFCAGIPGSVGGAVRMDAGSRTEWIGRRVTKVEIATAEGVRTIPGADVDWRYRQSSLPDEAVVVSVTLELERSSREAVGAEIARRIERRRATQPLGEPSCGSFFRNPEGQSVGRLIEDSGCKGYAVGGARVSDVHANFIVNEGHATARDVLAVGQHVHDAVLQSSGIDLAPEVRFVGLPGIERGDR